MIIGASMFTLLNYAKGRSHIFKYIKRSTQGSLFGVAYSFHFTSKKVIEWQTDDILQRDN